MQNHPSSRVTLQMRTSRKLTEKIFIRSWNAWKRPLHQTYRTSNILGKHSPHHSTKLLLSMTSSFRKVKNPLETPTRPFYVLTAIPSLTHLLKLLPCTTFEEVCRNLKALDDKKCAGDDGIPTRLLKAAASELSSSLCRLFNISFTKGDQLQARRDSTISPVQEMGSKTLPTNYRPISLLSVASKVEEKIVHDRLYNHIDPHLPPHQSGFRKKMAPNSSSFALFTRSQKTVTRARLLRHASSTSPRPSTGFGTRACGQSFNMPESVKPR